MKRACLPAWVLILPLLLLGNSASGQSATPTRILVLDPESKFLGAKQLSNLGDHLRSLAAKYQSLKVLRATGGGLTQLRLKVGCKGADVKCLALIGKAAKVQRVLYSRIQRLPGRYLLTMTLVDVEEGRVIEQSRKRARGEALRTSLLKSWVDVIGPLFRSKVKVRANLAGADVFLDGKSIGKTPLVLTKNLGKGDHIVEVTHQGYESVRMEVEIEKGRDLEIEVRLTKKAVAVSPVPVPPMPPPPEPPPEAQPVVGAKVVEKPVVKPEPAPSHAPFLPSLDKAEKQDQARTKPRVAGSPFYKRWWFWTVVGAVVAGGATGLVLGLSGGEEEAGIPAGKGRVTLEF